MAEPPPSQAAPHSTSLASAIPLVTGLVALIGGIAYAIMRYSYQQYYNVFGLTPDDVGPGSTAALTQSGAGVLEFVVLFAILPVTLALLGAAAVERTGRRWVAPGREKLLVSIVPPAAAAIGIYAAFTRLTNGHHEWRVLVALGVGVALLVLKRYDRRLPYEAASRLPRTRWIVAALMIVVAALELGGSLPKDATMTARCAIERNLPVRFVHTHRTMPGLDHIGVLRVRADPATLQWTTTTDRAQLPTRPLVYLGDSGGRFFVYWTARRQTVQIPDGDVLLTTLPRSPHCHYWESQKPRA